ncbi:hypothetical protein [Streptomyces sp. NPDC057579]|uniref:hypothetical protein n=1 Tax=Streptomyces sp. NPDC057579 TaxID=3346172 RepID=UPI0036899383
MTAEKGKGEKGFKPTIPIQENSAQKEGALKKQFNNNPETTGCPTVRREQPRRVHPAGHRRGSARL